jgi:hypothetical protein
VVGGQPAVEVLDAPYETTRFGGTGLPGFPPKSWRIPYAASGRMAVIFSYSIGGSNPAELCRRRAL